MYTNISVQNFASVLKSKDQENILSIDVRNPEEYAEEHILGVKNVPMSELAHHIPEFMRKEAIYVQCRSGGRSVLAIEWMQRAGVRAKLMNIDGGIIAWKAAKLPVTKSSPYDNHS